MSSLREQLIRGLESKQVINLSLTLTHHACVALILRGSSWENLELGYIQRAHSPTDRWSGQLAFPGGRREETDPTDLAAALRETLEEVGIDLQTSELLGRIDDIQAQKAGAFLDFYIRPFIFFIERPVTPLLDHSEVDDFFWILVKDLVSAERQTTYRVLRDNSSQELPAVNLDRPTPLWGLSYMITMNLFEHLKAGGYPYRS